MAPFFKHKPVKWIVYFGEKLKPTDLKDVDVAMVEPDHVDLTKFKDIKTTLIGYISLGEADETRPYWEKIKHKPYIIEPNPNWPGDIRVDMRNKEWQSLLLNEIIPSILNKGYKGLFLDTVDTAIYFEETQPKKFAGAKQAMIDLVKAIRKKFPDAILLPNNGLEFLQAYGDEIDGIIVEDLYTKYDFQKKKSKLTPKHEMHQKEEMLDQFKKKHAKKPIYNILYETSDKTDLAKYAISRSKQKQYEWYVTTVDLYHIGTIAY